MKFKHWLPIRVSNHIHVTVLVFGMLLYFTAWSSNTNEAPQPNTIHLLGITSENPPCKSTTISISNGMLSVQHAEGMLSVSLDNIEEPMIKGIHLNGYLDTQDHGRLVGGQEIIRNLPFFDTQAATMVNSDTTAGSSLRISKRFAGAAADISAIEEVRLWPNHPVVEYRLQLTNDSDHTLYIANVANLNGALRGEFSGLLQSPKRFILRDVLHKHHQFLPDYSLAYTEHGFEHKTKWGPEAMWTVVDGQQGYSLGITTLRHFTPDEIGLEENRWMLDKLGFRLGQYTTKNGSGPIKMEAGETIELGTRFVVCPPGTDAISVTRAVHKGTLTSSSAPFGNENADSNTVVQDAIQPPPPPALILPKANAHITDVASSFTWGRSHWDSTYDFQLARDAAFTIELKEHRVVEHLGRRAHSYENTLTPHPLATGEWYWRVRAEDPSGTKGAWSPSRMVHVGDEHTTRSPIRDITPENPLFFFNAILVKDISRVAEAIPTDIRPYCALSSVISDSTLATAETYDLSLMIRLGDLATVEHAFQHSDHVMGVAVGESFWGFFDPASGTRERIERAISLCAKYGRYFCIADGNGISLRWQELCEEQEFRDFVAKYKDYIVFMPKTNITPLSYTVHGALLGTYLTGMIDHLGIWAESWYWEEVGFRNIGERYGTLMGKLDMMPHTFWCQQMILGAAQGATVFAIEDNASSTMKSYNPTNPPDHYSALWDIEGNVTPAFENNVVPFIRGLLDLGIIPSREELRQQTVIAIRQDVELPERHSNDYGPYRALYEGTYGFEPEGEFYELFPNTGRYGFIPLLPSHVTSLWDTTSDSSPASQTSLLNLSELTNADKVRDIYDRAYPANHKGDALVIRNPKGFFAMTTSENEDLTQTFDFPLKGKPFIRLSGNIGPHAYMMGRLREHSLCIHTNSSHTEREIQLSITTTQDATKPTFTVSPKEALQRCQWDAETHTSTITFSHGFGHTEILITPEG